MKKIINTFKTKAREIKVTLLQNTADSLILVMGEARNDWEFNYFLRFAFNFDMFCVYVLDVYLD